MNNASVHLALDTTTEHASCAVQHSVGGIIYHKQTLLGRHASAVLVPWVQEILNHHSITPQQLRRVIVPCGPGSFTGIRLGLTVAQGLKLAFGTQTVGVNLLEFLENRIQAVHHETKTFFVLAPLLRGQSVGYFVDPHTTLSTLSPLKEPQTFSDDFLTSIQNRYDVPMFWDRHVPESMKRSGLPLIWDSRDLLAYGINCAPTNLVPLYIRPPSVTQPGGAVKD